MINDNARAAYLDHMRDSLTGRLDRDAPLPSSGVDGYRDEYRENGWDWPGTAPSMIGVRRMENVRRECERVLQENVPGDFIETGVWRGGACIMMRAVLKAYGITDRPSLPPTPLPARLPRHGVRAPTRKQTFTATRISPCRSPR
jgi:hypothetical protein